MITLDVSNELCKSDFYFVISLPLPQVPTEAGLLYRCASCMNWFTPPVAWATRPCLCATCPSCCRPCWISCLIKVSSQNTVRRKLEIEQNKLMFHCSIENLCGAFQLHTLPLKKKRKKRNLDAANLSPGDCSVIPRVLIVCDTQSQLFLGGNATLCSDQKSCGSSQEMKLCKPDSSLATQKRPA